MLAEISPVAGEMIAQSAAVEVRAICLSCPVQCAILWVVRIILEPAVGCVTGEGGNMVSDQQLLERIALDPKVMAGKPVIRGTRLTVDFILNLLAHGSTVEEILEEYDGLTREDVQACLLFATKSLEDTVFMPLAVEAA